MAQTSFTGPVASANGFIGSVTGNITGNVTGTLTSTTTTSAALLAIGNAVNTSGKALGATLYNTTTKTFYVAQGSTAGSTWIDASDGTTTITPV
jgi:hypothetical protein